MKIAIINISDRSGGSGIAAYRTAEALEKYHGHELFFLVRTKTLDQANIYQTTGNGFKAKLERLFNIGMNLLGLQYVWLPFSPWFILNKLEEIKPDVVWINNTVGGYFMTSHIRTIAKKYKVVWTLHDMWAFTANGAHTFGDESWKHLKAAKGERKIYPTIGLPIGNWLIRRKQRLFKDVDFTVVVPSTWMYNMAVQSPVLQGKRIELIPHGIDLDKFKPLDKEAMKEKYGIPRDAKTIAFIAQKLKGNFFKGGSDLYDILKHLNEQTTFPIHLLLMGEDSMPELNAFQNLIVHPMGYVKEEEKMVEILNATDVFVYPTRADNFPLVLLETITCGVPAISYNVGGCSDIINANTSGYLIDYSKAEIAAKYTLSCLNNNAEKKVLSLKARIYSVEQFSDKKIAQKYSFLFLGNNI
ncbi:MAG: glycosyl transferase group 1 [Cytophagaceae bacterium]|nr:glycosyl transferase group 1 [Cytophagaceae bacterium]